MDTILAANAKNGFSALHDKVQAEPVIISRHGVPVAVVMSVADFDARLQFKHEASDEANIFKPDGNGVINSA